MVQEPSNSLLIQSIINPSLRMRLMRHGLLWLTAIALVYRGFHALAVSVPDATPGSVLQYALLSTVFFGSLIILLYILFTRLTHQLLFGRLPLGLFLASLFSAHVITSEIVLAHYWLFIRLFDLKHLPRFYTIYHDQFTNVAVWQAPFDAVIVWTFSFSLIYNYVLYTVSLKVFKDLFTLSLRQVNLEKENLRLEFDFLKAQINPHFLFNTLNNLYSFSVRTPERVAPTVLKLADLMRYTLYETAEQHVPLSKELAFLSSYVELQRIRYDNHVRINYSTAGQLEGYSIAPLLLVVFVENAFKHGLQNSTKAAWVDIRIQLAAGCLLFQVDNSVLVGNRASPVGIGLKNVRKRLEFLYPGHYQLTIQPQANQFSITLTIELYDSPLPSHRFRR